MHLYCLVLLIIGLGRDLLLQLVFELPDLITNLRSKSTVVLVYCFRNNVVLQSSGALLYFSYLLQYVIELLFGNTCCIVLCFHRV